MTKRILSVSVAIAGALACIWGFGAMVGTTPLLGSGFSPEWVTGNVVLLAIIIGIGACALGICGLSDNKRDRNEQQHT